MSPLRQLWHELVRPRGPVRHRFYRLRRRSEAGVALLLVLTTILFMTVIVADIAFSATVRLRLAAHQRDEAKAEALAESGVGIYQLLLTASKAISKNPMVKQMLDIPEVAAMLGASPGDALWQLMPSINSGLMRMVFVSGGDAEDVDPNQVLTPEQLAESREETGMDRNFLDFDGDFEAEVTDEDRKISIASFTATNRADLQQDATAMKLYAMMSGMRACPDPYSMDLTLSASEQERDDLDKFFNDRSIDRYELIGNLADWTDPDNVRVFDGGTEDTVYSLLERDPYLPKNAGFDTLDEVRLVELWNRDDVWDRFGQNLTVYGKGKVNVNTAECDVTAGLLKTLSDPAPSDEQVLRLMKAMQEHRALVGAFSNAEQFETFLTTQGFTPLPGEVKKAFSAESKIFRVTSTGRVGGSTVTIDAIFDFSRSSVGKIVYWRIR